MSRYIDADALKETIMDMRNHCEPSPCLPHQTFLIPDRMVADKIDAMPTVDAVPVVRCENCKWAEVDAWWTYCKLGHKEDTTNSIIYTCTHDFYCADGERRNDGE